MFDDIIQAIVGFFIKLKKAFLSKKFLKFCGLGVINTFNDAFFSWLFHHFLQENVSAALGFAVAVTIAFFLCSKFIFKRKPTIYMYARFISSYIPNFIIYFLVTFITINVLNLPQFWATVLAAMTGGPITYIIIRFYAFGLK